MKDLRLLPIQEAILLSNSQSVISQITLRRTLLKDMVGWLYQSILESEIQKLYKRLHELSQPIGDYQI